MGQHETKSAWFKAGHWLPGRDNERGANEGLSRREIKALEAENSRPWGRKEFSKAAVSDRAKKAQRKR